MWLLIIWLTSHPAKDDPLMWELLCWITICLIMVNLFLIGSWIMIGYVHKPDIPRGWLRFNEKYLSYQWLLETTNLNLAAASFGAVVIFTFIFDAYKVITFVIDLFWFLTHVGNKFYSDYAKKIKTEGR